MCTERAIALVHMLTMKQLAEVLTFKYTKDIISIAIYNYISSMSTHGIRTE